MLDNLNGNYRQYLNLPTFLEAVEKKVFFPFTVWIIKITTSIHTSQNLTVIQAGVHVSVKPV